MESHFDREILMDQLHQLLGQLPSIGPSVKAWCVCFLIARAAFEATLAPEAATAGLALGAAVWAQPFLRGGWPVMVGLAPELTLAALSVALAAAAWSFAVYRRCDDSALAVIGAGAILGGGGAISYGVTLLAVRWPDVSGFDDVAYANAMAIISAAAVGAFALRRRWSGPWGQAAAALCLSAASVFAMGLARSALQLQPDGAPPAMVLSPAKTAAVAGVWLIGFVAGLRSFASPNGVRRATMLAAGDQRRPRFPWPPPAGTAFLRRAIDR